MTITIKIATSNAAFEDDREAEIARMLRKWLADNTIETAVLSDYNGNIVGSVKVTGK